MSISRRGPPFPACALTHLLLPQCTRFQAQGNVSGRSITCHCLMVKSTPRLQEDLEEEFLTELFKIIAKICDSSQRVELSPDQRENFLRSQHGLQQG